jgi:hypothetical protein
MPEVTMKLLDVVVYMLRDLSACRKQEVSLLGLKIPDADGGIETSCT